MNKNHYQIVIVGAGAAGIATAASLLKRRPSLSIALIDAAEKHYYQPSWTLVGAGEFEQADSVRDMKSLIPAAAHWIQKNVAGFEPENNQVVLDDDSQVSYDVLLAAPGLKLNMAGIEGLEETLGKNNVTTNYLYDLAPYTWKLVQETTKGNAIFTQPPMPIKCAGAPQKAVYLSSFEWEKRSLLKDINVEFHVGGPALFGVADFVPPLMKYIDRYGVDLQLNSNLVAVDGDARKAVFNVKDGDSTSKVERSFDFLHVVPPQMAPDFIRQSPLADAAGWVDVNQHSLQHKKYSNVFAAGDVSSSPNAKTAAAARCQAPIVAVNILKHMDDQAVVDYYNGYGACPLTVEKGKIILAEFGYNGKLLPTMPFNPLVPSKFYWYMKKKILPDVYWNYMFKGKETFVSPKEPDEKN